MHDLLFFLAAVAVVFVIFGWMGRVWLPRRRPMGPKWAARRLEGFREEEHQKA
ncbi:MAG: hypothetical protein KM310_09455 [Clostridiales bacterium]|nr:hypothetical protein [Clostridiales bacterium]